MSQTIINTYRMDKKINPDVVLCTLEGLLEKYKISYQDCLWKFSCSIIEYEIEGKLHSNRNKNAILSICKKYPSMDRFLQSIINNAGEGNISEWVCLRNFDEDTFSLMEAAQCSLISEIVKKVPRPYAVNELELIFSNVSWNESAPITKMQNVAFGCPKGSYIYYERTKYGDEKHSYIHFAADERDAEIIKAFAFDFCQSVKCKYEGTEIQ